MLITFSFAFNSETHEGAFVGNCDPFAALQILQQLVIADTVKQSQVKAAETEKTKLAEESLRRLNEEKRKS
jgi:hypothetical protein